MNTRPQRSWSHAATAALVAGLLAVPAWAEDAETGDATTAWNQAAVTQIAESLATAIDDVSNAFRRELSDMQPSGDRRSRYEVKDRLRRLRREADHLAKALKGGESHDETIDAFLGLEEMAHKTALAAKRARITQPTLDHIANARKYLTELAPYYGETWTPVLTER